MKVEAAGSDRLYMDGQIIDVPAPEGHDDNPGGSGPGGAHMKFAARLLVRTEGGTCRAAGEALRIEKADEVILLLTAATDYNLEAMNYDRSIDPGQRAEAILNRVAGKPWRDLRRHHITEHRAMFERVSLDLGGSGRDSIPTDERLERARQGEADPALAALYFSRFRVLFVAPGTAWFTVPWSLLVLGWAVSYYVWLAPREARGMRRMRHIRRALAEFRLGVCETCGYDLFGHVEKSVCPECGAAFERSAGQKDTSGTTRDRFRP